MGFRQGAYATTWESKKGKGNWIEVKLSISKKNKETGKYETEFSNWVRFIGDAKTKAESLGEKSRIKLGEVDVTNYYEKEKNVTYYNFAVFDFEFADESRNVSPGNMTGSDGYMNVPDNDELPFR